MTEHIQINDVSPRIQYVADGVQSAFTFPFAIFKAADLAVWVDGVQQSTGFTVSGAGISSGGTVLFGVPPAAAAKVTLTRHLSLNRTSDYQTDGLIRAKTLNDELDYQVAALQQVAEEVSRAVIRSAMSSNTADLTLPEPLAGRSLKWSSSALGLVNSDADPDLVVARVTADAAQVAADRSAVQIATAAAQAARVDAQAARDTATAAAASVGEPLSAPANLSDLRSPSAARSNLGVYSKAEVDVAIAAGATADLFQRVAFLELNLAVNTLRDQIDAGWSVLKMVDGIADEFEDETGVATGSSSNQTYDAVGDYYANQSGAYTANVANTGTASASATYIGTPGNANNGDTSDASYWHPNAIPSWWAVTFPSARAIRKVILYPYGSQTISGTVQYWNGSAWAESGASFNGGKGHTVFPTTGSSTQWRLNITGASASNFSLSEVEMMEATPAGNMTLLSQPFAADAVPTQARLVLLHQPLSSVTLNTDCTIEASRDNGVTWTAGALVNEGAFDSSTNILTALVDLSAQPSGTAMKWRFKTLNQKEQRLHGVWMQWR